MSGSDEGTVLVVEDDASIRELLCEALAQEGLTVAAAADGDEAVRAAAARKPALVILDIELPLLGGAEVAAAIRERYGDEVPILVMTASRTIETAAAEVRARAYFTKPFDLNDVVRAVRSVLEPPPATMGEDEPAPAPAT